MARNTTIHGDIAVGTPVFSRTDALEQLLDSIPGYVVTVYIADNGHTEERDELYQQGWPFDLEVIDMDYDVGIGPCRHAIAEAVDETYLFVCDSDMELTRSDDLKLLRTVLEHNPNLGGVAGWLNEGNTLRSGARNLQRHNDTIIKNVNDTPELERDPVPFARFDFIPQAALYRTEIFDTYMYDPEIFNSEHIDFFLGQQDAGKWDFASTPAVVIQHHRNIDPEYRQSKRGKNFVDWDLMEEKWGLTFAVPGPRSDWITNRDTTTKEEAFNLFRKATPAQVWMPVRGTLKKIGLA